VPYLLVIFRQPTLRIKKTQISYLKVKNRKLKTLKIQYKREKL